MKSLRLFRNHTKKGVASIYVVVFATILFGVVTLSFTRIILSEASQSSNDDLSRSAYDAALAGVEDAKLMVNRYYDCVSNNNTTGECRDIAELFNDDSCEDDDGFALARLLYGIIPDDEANPSGEVFIQESGDSTTETSADQAYTCVLISDITPDYRGTLSNDTRTKVVPIQIVGSGATIDGSANQLGRITFSWYSDLNQGTQGGFENLNTDNTGKFPAYSAKTTPPTIQLTLIKTPKTLNLSDFHREDNAIEVIYSTMVFLPSADSVPDQSTVAPGTIREAGNASKGEANIPFTVNCRTDREFACVVNLEVSGLGISAESNVLLVASLPYGDAYTDFAVSLSKLDGTPISFKGAQISVDSTGRTNQLFRRVETRLDPADLFFPYPQFALESGDTGNDDSIKKYFWVTANCWTEKGKCDNNGNL